MGENKVDKYLQFLNGVVINQQLWCVDKNKFLLLKIDINTWDIVDAIDLKRYIESQNMTRKIFQWNNELYITFLMGMKILCVDIETLVITEIECKGESKELNMNAVLYNGSIYVFPRTMKGHVSIYDLQNKTANRIPLIDCNEEIFIANTCLVGDVLYGITIGSNLVLYIDLNTLEWRIKEFAREYKLIDLVYLKDNLWFLEKNTLLICSKNFEICETVDVPKKLGSFSHMIPCENEIILMPYVTTKICKYNLTDMVYSVLKIKGEPCTRSEKGTLSFGYTVWDKKLILFPWTCNAVLTYQVEDSFLQSNIVFLNEVHEYTDYFKTKSCEIIAENLFEDLNIYMDLIKENVELSTTRDMPLRIGKSILDELKAN